MKLEVVDKRNPVFIRVATIVDTDDYRIKVSFSVLLCYPAWVTDEYFVEPKSYTCKIKHRKKLATLLCPAKLLAD